MLSEVEAFLTCAKIAISQLTVMPIVPSLCLHTNRFNLKIIFIDAYKNRMCRYIYFSYLLFAFSMKKKMNGSRRMPSFSGSPVCSKTENDAVAHN